MARDALMMALRGMRGGRGRAASTARRAGEPEEVASKLPTPPSAVGVDMAERERAESGQTDAEETEARGERQNALVIEISGGRDGRPTMPEAASAECPMCGATDHGEEEHESMMGE